MNHRLMASLGRLPGARRAGAVALALATLTLPFFALRSRSPAPTTPVDRFVLGGVAVELGIEPIDPAARGAPLREGEDVTFRFTITDARSGAPLSRVAPAARVDGRDPGAFHCFTIDVARDPDRPADNPHPVAVELLVPGHAIVVGQPAKVRLRLTDPSAGTPRSDLSDRPARAGRRSCRSPGPGRGRRRPS